MNDTASRARTLFDSGYYCAESVLLALAEAQGVHSDIIPRIATGFCSGIARTGGQCGALSGAIMGLGLLYGRSSPDDTVDQIYDQVRSLMESFNAKFGSTSCRQLTGCDLGTEEGQEAFHATGGPLRCAGYTEEVTRLAMALMEL